MKNSHNNFKKLDKNESVRLDYKPTGFGDFFLISIGQKKKVNNREPIMKI